MRPGPRGDAAMSLAPVGAAADDRNFTALSPSAPFSGSPPLPAAAERRSKCNLPTNRAGSGRDADRDASSALAFREYSDRRSESPADCRYKERRRLKRVCSGVEVVQHWTDSV